MDFDVLDTVWAGFYFTFYLFHQLFDIFAEILCIKHVFPHDLIRVLFATVIFTHFECIFGEKVTRGLRFLSLSFVILILVNIFIFERRGFMIIVDCSLASKVIFPE